LLVDREGNLADSHAGMVDQGAFDREIQKLLKKAPIKQLLSERALWDLNMEPVDCGMPYPQLSRHRQLANSFGNKFTNALNRFLEFRKQWQSAQQFLFASTRMPVLQQRIETVADDSDLGILKRFTTVLKREDSTNSKSCDGLFSDDCGEDGRDGMTNFCL
jgi:hypothetical protein